MVRTQVFDSVSDTIQALRAGWRSARSQYAMNRLARRPVVQERLQQISKQRSNGHGPSFDSPEFLESLRKTAESSH